MHGLTTKADAVNEIPRWSDYRYVLSFALCMAIVTATFLLFMARGWGLVQVPATFSWPQLGVLSTALSVH
jgi:hypothetical protein